MYIAPYRNDLVSEWHQLYTLLLFAFPLQNQTVMDEFLAPACIHLERKWTNLAALQSFTIPAASAVSLRGTDVWADVPSAWGFILVERVTVYKLTLHR